MVCLLLRNDMPHVCVLARLNDRLPVQAGEHAKCVSGVITSTHSTPCVKHRLTLHSLTCVQSIRKMSKHHRIIGPQAHAGDMETNKICAGSEPPFRVLILTCTLIPAMKLRDVPNFCAKCSSSIRLNRGSGTEVQCKCSWT